MPQPIDLQTELGRVTTMDRVQQIADRLALAAHQRLAEQSEQQQVAAESQTQETEQKNEEVDRDLKRHTPYGRRRQSGEPEDESKQEHRPRRPPPDLEEHQLDVTV